MALFKAIDWSVDMDNLEAFTVFRGTEIKTDNPLELKVARIVTLSGISHNVIVDMRSEAGHPFTYTTHFIKLADDIIR